MASIQLYNEEVREGVLPFMCICCGRPAVVEKRKTFSWFPPWVYVIIVAGLIPFAIVAVVLTKRRTVYAPLCADHQAHWLWRALVTWLSLGGMIVLAVGSFVLLAALDPGGRRGDDLVGFLCLAWFVVLVVWLICIAVIQSTAIRTNQITDDSITLIRVSPIFVDVVERERDRQDEAYRKWEEGRGSDRQEGRWESGPQDRRREWREQSDQFRSGDSDDPHYR